MSAPAVLAPVPASPVQDDAAIVAEHLTRRFGTVTALDDGLYAACDARFLAMLEVGALDEVRALLARGLPASLPVMKAIGVAELGAVLAGRSTLAAATAAAQQATRNYAKRQRTWFRHQMIANQAIETKLSESTTAEIFSKIRHFVLTHRY